MGQLCAEYMEGYQLEAKAKGIEQKSVRKVRACLALIADILGAQTAVSTLGYDVCLQFRNTLAKVPANRTKLFGDMTLDRVIELATANGARLMAYPRFKLNSRAMHANRARLLIGGESIKPGEFVAKLCRNRLCVRPEHHAVGTRVDAIACSTRGTICPITISLIAANYRAGQISVAQIPQCFLIGKRLAQAIIAESDTGKIADDEAQTGGSHRFSAPAAELRTPSRHVRSKGGSKRCACLREVNDQRCPLSDG